MTFGGLDALFNPAKQHMEEEKLRLQSTREEVGDASGGKRIDLDSGRVTLDRRRVDAGNTASDDPNADDPNAEEPTAEEHAEASAVEPKFEQSPAAGPISGGARAGTSAPTSGAAQRARDRRRKLGAT